MQVFYSEDVEGDLDTIAAYIAADNPSRAVTFIGKIYAEIRRIGHDARLAVVGLYVILFRVAEEGVYVERIVQGGRDLPPLYQ